MNTFNQMLESLGRRQFWGPSLIGTGALLVYFLFNKGSSEATWLHYVIAGLATLLVLSGIVMMFYQVRVREDDPGLPTTLPTNPEEAELTISQLSKNYDLLRKQTTQGFILAGVFMSLGLLVILSGSVGKLFGFSGQGSNLTSVAGIIMEFISGTSLLIYRINFQRLNATTDKLDSAWRILTAHKLAAELPQEKRDAAILNLINALIQSKSDVAVQAAQSAIREINS
jgi:hypothetical protein